MCESDASVNIQKNEKTKGKSVNQNEAVAVIVQVRTALGSRYKMHIRDAWMDGNYQREGLGQWAGQLQQIRNGFGPSWLHRLRLGFSHPAQLAEGGAL
jgi:hypothetical protein